jgi:hypothetical protein
MKIYLVVMLLLVASCSYSEEVIVDKISWLDNVGEHEIIIIEKFSGQYFEPNWKSSIVVRKNSIWKGENSMSWEINDFSTSPSETVNYLPKTLKIFDQDGDGVMESSFLYLIGTDGLDNNKLKQMVHKNNVKLAIRGDIPKRLADIDEYKIRIDKVYSSQTKDLIIKSLEIWNVNISNILNALD